MKRAEERFVIIVVVVVFGGGGDVGQFEIEAEVDRIGQIGALSADQILGPVVHLGRHHGSRLWTSRWECRGDAVGAEAD